MTDILTGKGFYIWKLKNCEGGDPQAMANEAKAAGLSHVVIKILDGVWSFNMRPYYDRYGQLQWADDIIGPAIAAFRGVGLKVWGWQYVYLGNPALEAQKAVQRAGYLQLDGFVIDIEKEGKNQPAKTKIYCDNLRAIKMPVALSTYRRPDLHPEIDYKTWLSVSDLVMPQVYWELAHNPGRQLDDSLAKWAKLTEKPYLPTGAAYRRGAWAVTPEDLVEFMARAQTRGLPGLNFWVWNDDHAKGIPGLWQTISNWDFGGTTPPPPGPGTVPLADWAQNHAYPWMVTQGYNGPMPI